MNKTTYDVIIVGAGPIGMACGVEASKRKLKYLILEKGCLVNSIYNFPVNMTFFSTSERLEIGGVPFVSHGTKPTRWEALEYYRRVKSAWNLKVNYFEKVEEVSRGKNLFEVASDKGNYRCRYLVLATGYYDHPNLMNIPGENLPKVFHYYKEPHPFNDQKVAIVGGGNSAVDVALETFRHGAEVTMIVKKKKLDKNVKYWVRPDIENRIKEGSIKAFFNAKLVEIKEKEIVVEQNGKRIILENDFVFAMTGYHPDFKFLAKTGIEFEGRKLKIPSVNSETQETNIPDLFLAGVVCGGMDTGRWFIENSIEHAARIFDAIEKRIRGKRKK
jgi:thioredoxin reductase (NADPH)